MRILGDEEFQDKNIKEKLLNYFKMLLKIEKRNFQRSVKLIGTKMKRIRTGTSLDFNEAKKNKFSMTYLT